MLFFYYLIINLLEAITPSSKQYPILLQILIIVEYQDDSPFKDRKSPFNLNCK